MKPLHQPDRAAAARNGDPARSCPSAVLLVGGLGTRLRSVLTGSPKALASVGDTPFLELLVRQLRSQGIRDIVMCTGYLADQIEGQFGDGSAWDVKIRYSREPQPLGTAGALKLAQPLVNDASSFLAMNGDSFLEADFNQLMRFHEEAGGIATIAVCHLADTARYGTVEVGAESRVVGFIEKTGRNVGGVVNAGVYVFRSAILEHLPDGPASLEKDVFPRLVKSGVYACEQRGMFIDIGTPEDYARAQSVCDRLYEAAYRHQLDAAAGPRRSDV